MKNNLFILCLFISLIYIDHRIISPQIIDKTNNSSLKTKSINAILSNLNKVFNGDKEKIEDYLKENVLKRVPIDLHIEFTKQYFFLFSSIRPNLRVSSDLETEIHKRESGCLNLGFEWGFTVKELIENLKIPKSYVLCLNAHILDLSNLKINSLEGLNRINNLHKIKYLVLNNNQITYINPDAFIGLEHLIDIELNDNHIDSIAIDAFTKLPHLNKLELKNNFLTDEVKKKLKINLARTHIIF